MLYRSSGRFESVAAVPIARTIAATFAITFTLLILIAGWIAIQPTPSGQTGISPPIASISSAIAVAFAVSRCPVWGWRLGLRW